MYASSPHVTKSPRLPPLYLYTASNQVLEEGMAWERGYGMHTCMEVSGGWDSGAVIVQTKARDCKQMRACSFSKIILFSSYL